MLTASDVEQKTFSTALRGYDLDEVDDFLDEIVATIRGLNEQLEEAKGGGAPVTPVPVAKPEPKPEPEPEPEPEPAPIPEPITPAPAIDESAIGRALIAAQTAADKMLEDAQVEATRIVGDAQQEADLLEEQKQAKRLETETEIAGMAARVAAVRAELSVLADTVATNLDEMDAVIAGDQVTADDATDGDDDDITTGFIGVESDEEDGDDYDAERDGTDGVASTEEE